MKLEFLTDVKDTVEGLPTSFEKGDICGVPDPDAYRFIGHGWAKKPNEASGGDGSQSPVDLDIQNGVLGSKSTTL